MTDQVSKPYLSKVQGHTLQRYNMDLMKFIDSIRLNRDDLHDEIGKDEEEKQQLETQIM